MSRSWSLSWSLRQPMWLNHKVPYSDRPVWRRDMCEVRGRSATVCCPGAACYHSHWCRCSRSRRAQTPLCSGTASPPPARTGARGSPERKWKIVDNNSLSCFLTEVNERKTDVVFWLVLMACSNYPTARPIQRQIKNDLYRTVWRYSYYTDKHQHI